MEAAPGAAAGGPEPRAFPLNSPRKVVTFGHRRVNPRVEFRLRRNAQVDNSPTLAEKFPKLKSLQITVDYFDSTGATRSGGMKHKVNVTHGKSLLCFNCANHDCSGGDYDLSDQLAEAIARKQKLVDGELRCQGIRHNRERKTDIPCQAIMRYRLTLAY